MNAIQNEHSWHFHSVLESFMCCWNLQM